jgi:site-specific DNA-methyltransferase (adenine-specific)
VGSLSELPSHGEPGTIVYRADCVRLMRLMPVGCVDAIFADPPYRLSGGGVTVKVGGCSPWTRASGRPRGFAADHEFNVGWLSEARRVLKPDGTLWVTGTHHIISSLGYALQSLGFRIINHVVWEKPDPPPNAKRTSFKHSHAITDDSGGVVPRRAHAGGRGERGTSGSLGGVTSSELAKLLLYEIRRESQ